MNKQYPNEFNGHRNWDYWNVACWLLDDETLNNLAREFIASYPTYRKAAASMKRVLEYPEFNPSAPGYTKDGVKYTQRNIEAALRIIGEQNANLHRNLA